MKKVKKATKAEISEIQKRFVERYSDAVTELKYENSYELVIAVALSAQCTDKRVNLITPQLFKKYPSVEALADARLDDIKEIIKSCSFYNNKAKNILQMAKRVVEVYNGEIPMDTKELVTLAGVGQKTANVVMIEYANANLMAVDTHVFRVSHRLGLSKATNVKDTERDLVKKFKDNLAILHQAMVLFGRYSCKAVAPECQECILANYCKTKKSF